MRTSRRRRFLSGRRWARGLNRTTILRVAGAAVHVNAKVLIHLSVLDADSRPMTVTICEGTLTGLVATACKIIVREHTLRNLRIGFRYPFLQVTHEHIVGFPLCSSCAIVWRTLSDEFLRVVEGLEGGFKPIEPDRRCFEVPSMAQEIRVSQENMLK